MDLSKVSHNVNLAKLDNARWLEYAYALTQGNSVSKEGMPKYRDECPACHWLYDHSEQMRSLYQKIDRSEIDLFHFDFMEQIEILRYDLHEKYLQIFNIYYPELYNSFLASLFRRSKRLSENDRTDAHNHYREMQQIVNALDNKLDYLEQSIDHLCSINSA